MKPIKPKYTNMIKTEVMISDVAKEILSQYAKCTKYTESEINERNC